MNSDRIPKILGWKTIHLIPEIFIQRLDKQLLIFNKFFNIKTNSLSFSQPNFVNLEPIEGHLNNIFANKYSKYNAD